jgi:hypothetical protein
VRATGHRQHVMLAEGDDADVFQHHQLVVTSTFLEGAFKIIAGLGRVADKQLAKGARTPLRISISHSRLGPSPAHSISTLAASSVLASLPHLDVNTYFWEQRCVLPPSPTMGYES